MLACRQGLLKENVVKCFNRCMCKPVHYLRHAQIKGVGTCICTCAHSCRAIAERQHPLSGSAILHHPSNLVKPEKWRSMSRHQHNPVYAADAESGEPQLNSSVGADGEEVALGLQGTNAFKKGLLLAHASYKGQALPGSAVLYPSPQSLTLHFSTSLNEPSHEHVQGKEDSQEWDGRAEKEFTKKAVYDTKVSAFSVCAIGVDLLPLFSWLQAFCL
eukprot:scaffold298219_cov18-Tisochrysis_lutea.AAC.1